MKDSIEKIINDIVDSLSFDSLHTQKRYFLTQSLLSLARTANMEGHRRGCHETIEEIHRQLDATYELTGLQISELAAAKSKMTNH